MKVSLAFVATFGLFSLAHADTVHLRISDPDGKPVVGAKVLIIEAHLEGTDYKEEAPVNLQSDATGLVTVESKTTIDATLPANKRTHLLTRVLTPGMGVAMLDLKAGDNALTLTKGQSFGGVVADADGKPIAGVKVALTQVPLSPQVTWPSLSDAFRLETQSDAQGKWQLDNLPLSGQAKFTLTDSRFATMQSWTDLTQPASPFYVRPASAIKGRLVGPDGTPLAGITFYVGGDFPYPKTSADGTFQVNGLDVEVTLDVVTEVSPKLPFIVPAKGVKDLQPGETRDIGDWKAVTAVRVRGKVVDAATNKPLPESSMTAFGEGIKSTYANGDKNGQVDFLALPGISDVNVSATGYMPARRPNIPEARDGIIDLGTIALQIAHKISGTIKTPDGAGFSTMIYIRKADGTLIYADSRQDGSFAVGVPDTGEYTLSVSGYKLQGDRKVVVGEKELPPLRLVVDNRNDPATPRTVTGRVLCDGKPVPNVHLQIEFRTETADYGTLRATSDLNGSFSVTSGGPVPRAVPSLVNFSHPGFVSKPSEFKVENGAWHGDVTLQKLGILRGRIVDAAKRPVAGAFVAWDRELGLPVASDAKGEFALKDVPLSDINLLASDGARFQSFKLEKEGDAVQIVLPDAPEVPNDKTALIDQIAPGVRADWEWGEQWNTAAYPSVGEMIARKRLPYSFFFSWDGSSWRWSDILHDWAERDPAKFLARQDELRAHTEEADIPEFERLLMLARASSKDAATRAQAKSWLAAQEGQKRDISQEVVKQLLGLAEIAQKIDPALGAAWLDEAAAIAEHINGDANADIDLWGWGALAAHLSPQAVDALSEEWKPAAKIKLLSSALRTDWSRSDAANARRTFAAMETLAAQLSKEGTTIQMGTWPYSAKDFLHKEREFLVPALAPNDPAGALEAALPLPTFQRMPALLTVARSAVEHKDFDAARKALNAILAADPVVFFGHAPFKAQAAQIALSFDPTLADALFAKAYEEAMEKRGFFNASSPTISDYAQARAAKWPGESRVLLEREWAKRTEIQKEPISSSNGNEELLKSLAVAMTSVSPARALEMASALPTKDKNWFPASGRQAIVITLLRAQQNKGTN